MVEFAPLEMAVAQHVGGRWMNTRCKASALILLAVSLFLPAKAFAQNAEIAALLNELPTGRSFQNIAILVPGVQRPLVYSDVGGSDGARWQTMTVHGSRDDQMPLLMNGMPFNNMNNSGGGYNHTLAINTGTVQ